MNHPYRLGKFIYYTLTCGLEDINIPYLDGTPEYEHFIDGFHHAYAEQSRRYLRLGMKPEILALFYGINDPVECIRKATKSTQQ